MAQIFHPSTNVISKLSIVAVAVLVPALGVAGYFLNMTYGLAMQVPLPQPVEFSHQHHVTDDGIDCRYCHSSVDKAASAGMPSTEVCMTCHSQIWKDSPLIKPIYDSYRTGKPIEWNRVHDLPDFAYFNHSIHVQKGVSCVSCHGRVDKMPITWKEKDLSMAWCLDCHRNPEKNLRPREQVYNLGWKPKEPQEKLGKELIEKYHVLSELQLTSCSTCHH
ncbi:MAG: cytochrome c3 family protein [Actinomycetota bacterium]